MEKSVVGDLSMELEDYAEFEQRGRSHTWPEQDFVQRAFDDPASSTTDLSYLSPSVGAHVVTLNSGTRLALTPTTSLSEALQSNLCLTPETALGAGPSQNLHPASGPSKQAPIRTHSELQITAPIENARPRYAAASYPSLAELLAQKPNQTISNVVPAPSSPPPSQAPQPQLQPTQSQPQLLLLKSGPQRPMVEHLPSTSSSIESVATSGSIQSSVSDLVPVSDCAPTSLVTLRYSDESLTTGYCSEGRSLQSLTSVPLEPRTASSLSLPSTCRVRIVRRKPLPPSNILLSGATSSESDIQSNISSSQAVTVAEVATSTEAAAPAPAPPTEPYRAEPEIPEEPIVEDPEDPGEKKPGKKKRIRRKNKDGETVQKKENPWGKESYSELIDRALLTHGRMRLNEIYKWFITNVPYFAERTSHEQSSGWKNSIRHNLSLHSRFMRIQNEGAGKSSWWVINPDAKPGRNPRRQRSATLENTTKAAMDKKRRGARKKVMELREMRGGGSGSLHSVGSSIVGSQASVMSRELYPDNDDSLNFQAFRSRTQSNISTQSSRETNYSSDNVFDRFDFPPFVEAANRGEPMPSDILNRTHEINLNQSDSPAFQRPMANPMLNGDSISTSMIAHIKTEPSSSRTENGVQPPPSYHELDVVRGISNMQNPLLQGRISNQAGMSYNGSYTIGSGGVGVSNWMHSSVSPIGISPSMSCAAQQSFSGNTAALPVDLENLTMPDQGLMDVEEEAIQAVLENDVLSQSTSQLSFENI